MNSTVSPLLHGLNVEQQSAVTAKDGPILVVAGPGSGKTRVLTHRIAWLISEKNVPAGGILAVTFTNKAAREMKDRVGRLLSDGEAEGLTMGTFHSLGVRMLRENPGLVADRLGILRNFTIYDDSDQMQTAKLAVQAAGFDPKVVAPRRMLSRISAAKSILLAPEDVAAQAATYDDEVVSRVYREYQNSLSDANAVDFDDLLGLPIRLFDAQPSLLSAYQQRFHYILVDEYQDTNRVQYVLVSALSDYFRNLFVVGDPDQSIYRWRQADIRNILDFEQDFPDAQRIVLETNYRSTARIVAVADSVIRENAQRIDRTLRTDNEDGEPISIRELADHQHEAQFVADEIRRLMHQHDWPGDAFAVMYRTGAQSRVLEEAFRMSGMPYQIIGGVRFYDRKEVKDVLAVLRLLHNPQDRVSLDRVTENMPIGRGFGPKAMDAVQDWARVQGQPLVDCLVSLSMDPNAAVSGLSGTGRGAALRIGDGFRRLRTIAAAKPLAELFDDIVGLTGYREAFDHSIEDELDRWANVLEVRADMQKYDSLPPGEALSAYLEQVALVADVDALADDRRGKVTLITLHSAKGLEFPVVFITGLEEGLLPVSRAIEAEFDDPAAIEEERRLFYVGITRAQRILYLTRASSRLTYGRFQMGVQSRFLDGLPHQHIRDLGRRSTLSSRGASSLAMRTRLAGQMSDPYSPATPARPIAVRTYRNSERVFHPKFGEGTIVEIIERRDDQELSIDFARHGKKRFLASLTPLDTIAEPALKSNEQ
ncbi:UvrD-helicase domain-containing protein [soil metagenome]